MKRISLYLLFAFYALAGINHFIHPGAYISMMPSWLPYPKELVLISGIIEILLALMLLFPRTRKAGAWGIIILLIAVFPANVQMMVNYYNNHDPYLWVTIIRLPLQLLLIWWAYSFTKPEGNS